MNTSAAPSEKVRMPVVDDVQAVRESLRRSPRFDDCVVALTAAGNEPRLIHTVRGAAYLRIEP